MHTFNSIDGLVAVGAGHTGVCRRVGVDQLNRFPERTVTVTVRLVGERVDRNGRCLDTTP